MVWFNKFQQCPYRQSVKPWITTWNCRLTTTVKQMSTIVFGAVSQYQQHSRSLQEVCKKQTDPNKPSCTAHWPWSTGFFINFTQSKLAPSVTSTINQLASCMPSSPTYRRTKSVVSSRAWAISQDSVQCNNKVFLSNARCSITYMYVCMDFILHHSHTPIYPSPN